MLCEHVVGPGFEPFQYLSICMLDLPIALRMSNRGEAELDTEVLAVVPKQGTCELGAIIGDDSVRDTEATCDTADELKCCVLGNLDNWDHLRPLGELVDGDVEVLIAPDCSGEWTQDVQPPDREGPR